MADRIEYLPLVGSFIDLSLLLLVQLNEDFDLCSGAFNTSRRVFDELWLHEAGKALKIPSFGASFQIRNARNLGQIVFILGLNKGFLGQILHGLLLLHLDVLLL